MPLWFTLAIIPTVEGIWLGVPLMRSIVISHNFFATARKIIYAACSILRWPKRVKHKSVYQNTKQFPKTQINFPKHKSVYQNTKQFLKTQTNFPKHKSVYQNTNQFHNSRNTNQKTGHLLCHYQRAWKGLIPRIFRVQHGDF